MEIRKGYCRIVLESGLITFGEIRGIGDDHVVFHAFNPAAIGHRIPVSHIVDIDYYGEDDIPAYE